MPGDFRTRRLVALAQRVERGEQARRGLERVDPGIRPRRMRGFAFDPHLEVQAAIVRHDDVVGKAGADHVIGLREPSFEDEARADGAAHFLVIGEMELDRAVERDAAFAQGL